MKTILAGVLLALSQMAGAATLGLHLGSVHVPARDYNNVNPGVYYIADNGFTAGTYYNSIRNQSVYAGYTWDYGRFRLTAGVVTGYRYKVAPMLAPSIKLGHGFSLLYLPRIGKLNDSHVFHIIWEKRL